jgi:hypothetical protein
MYSDIISTALAIFPYSKLDQQIYGSQKTVRFLPGVSIMSLFDQYLVIYVVPNFRQQSQPYQILDTNVSAACV